MTISENKGTLLAEGKESTNDRYLERNNQNQMPDEKKSGPLKKWKIQERVFKQQRNQKILCE